MTPSQLQAEADRLAQEAIERGTSQNFFTQTLQDAIDRRMNFNRDLLDAKNEAIQGRLALPTQLRSEFAESEIRNPLEREQIISGRRATANTRIGSILDALAARGQSTSDIIGRASAAFGEDVARRQGLAQLAQQRADRALAAAERARAGGGGGSIADMVNEWLDNSFGNGGDDFEIETVKKPLGTSRSWDVDTGLDTSGLKFVGGNLLSNLRTGFEQLRKHPWETASGAFSRPGFELARRNIGSLFKKRLGG